MNALSKLYRGESHFNFIGSRKRWYSASGVLIAICVLAFVFRGFNFGVEFAGGTQFQILTKGAAISTSEVEDAFSKAGLKSEGAAQDVGSGDTRQIVVKTKTIPPAQQATVIKAVAKALKIDEEKNVSSTSVSSDWGRNVTERAILGLIVFLIVVSIYIALRYGPRMSAGAMVALLHDLVIAAGVYSLVGFEVTPSTVVGLLTILGFSLYDTVVVYDKVAENSRNILAESKMTYSEAANLAVNQTLMRSINTSLIALLPVAGLLFVGAGILGVGTIKDLALILFVGLASGAYSSLFLATPVVVDLTERGADYKALTRRVTAKRASERKAGVELAGITAASVATAAASRRGHGPMPAPKPGARPQRKR